MDNIKLFNPPAVRLDGFHLFVKKWENEQKILRHTTYYILTSPWCTGVYPQLMYSQSGSL
jgi:hypothetical protein